MCFNNRKCQIFLLIMTILTDGADIICDWLFYVDISRLKPGLVYGPPEQGYITAVLVTSIIGSIFLIAEIANSCKGLRNNEPWVNINIMLLLTVWVADLPEIVVSTIIAACREDPVSIFQLSKASVVLLGMAYRFLIYLLMCCDGKLRESISKLTGVLISIGLILNTVGSILIFIFTQANLKNGGISITAPKNTFDEVHNNERYFKNVDIFYHHPTFRGVGLEQDKSDFVRLTSINEISSASSNAKFLFNYEYEETNVNVKMVFWKKTDELWKAEECYNLTKATGSINTGNNCGNFITNYSESIFIALTFVPPESFFHTLIIGDIRFNIKVKSSTGCSNMASASTQSLHYYQTEAPMTTFLNQTKFYQSQIMKDITTVWKTGWLNCSTTGSLAPNMDNNLDVPCSRT